MENSFIEKFEIKLDPRDYYYTPNDQIKGELHIKLSRALLLKNVNIIIVGVIQFFGKAKNGLMNRIESEEKILFHCLDLVEMLDMYSLRPGDYDLLFEYKLPNGIHSTFDGLYGQIKYYIEADIDKSVLSNVLPNRIYFDVMSPPNFSVDEMRLPVGKNVEKTLRFLFFKRGAVRLSAHLDRKGYYIGDEVLISYSVANRSSDFVRPKVTLYQMENYFVAEGFWVPSKVKVCEEEGNDIAPVSVSSGKFALKIPFNLKACSFKSSLIKVDFKIDVALVIRGSFDLHIDLPLLISDYIFFRI